MTIEMDLIELCEQFPCAPETRALAKQFATPAEFIGALRQENLSVDAVQSLARCLPKEKAVEWGGQSARMAGETVALTPEETQTLDAVDKWLSQPDAAGLDAVTAAATDLPPDSPAGSVAHAASFSQEMALPEEAAMPSMDPNLTGHFAACAVLLAAAKTTLPEGAAEVEEGAAPPETPKIPELPEIPELAEKPEQIAVEKVAEALPTEELVPEGGELIEAAPPPEMPADQQAQVADVLAPFLDMGTKLAETVPGWM